MDTDSFTYQFLHNQLYQLTGSNVITVPIPQFVVASCVAVILPVGGSDSNIARFAMPYMTVANGSVTIRSRHPQEPSTDPSYGSQIQFRLMAMRYSN